MYTLYSDSADCTMPANSIIRKTMNTLNILRDEKSLRYLMIPVIPMTRYI